MITPADDYPLHQTSRAFRDPGVDRNLYDRFFFCGYPDSGDMYFAAAFGQYPGRNVADAAFSLVCNGVQRNVRGSRLLGADRLDLQAGPLRVELVEPLKRVHLMVDDPASGMSADLMFSARAVAFEEPHYRWAPGHLTVFDITRLTQNGEWEGWIQADGVRHDVQATAWRGTRDRSWGIRPMGARDTTAAPDGPMPTYYWLWAPLNFDDMNVLFDVNEDSDGSRWHENAAITLPGSDASIYGTHTYGIDWRPGTRHADGFTMMLQLPTRSIGITLQPRLTFFMQGIGYSHPTWGHGMWVGPDERTHDSFVSSDAPEADPLFNHVQILCDAVRDDGVRGMGILEMLISGPHAPSGFATYTDVRP